MKTITFYSYKGGVGRSLALANIANRLAEFGKKVCMLDFDLEAPGLHIKFSDSIGRNGIKKGLVDYIYKFTSENVVPENISDYVTEVNSFNEGGGTISLIAAGNTSREEYWKKLSHINWTKLFYEKDSLGVDFFYNLKLQIENQLAPDVLLIDSRTGITDIAGVTMSIMADEVVLFAANNMENLDGIGQVLCSLAVPSNSLRNETPKINVVLSRIPYFAKAKDKPREANAKNAALRILNEKLEYKKIKDYSIEKIFVVHSEPELEMQEEIRIHHRSDELISQSVTSSDYLELFEELTLDVVVDLKEADELDNFMKANVIVDKAVKSTNREERISLLKEAIILYPRFSFAYLYLGVAYLEGNQYTDAIANLDIAEVLNPQLEDNIRFFKGHILFKQGRLDDASDLFEGQLDSESNEVGALSMLGLINYKKKDYDKSVMYYQRAVDRDPENPSAWNGYANSLRVLGRYSEGFEAIYKALEISPQHVFANTTLAELNASTGNYREFYKNMDLAFSLGLTNKDFQQMVEDDELYFQFIFDENLQKILDKYKIDVDWGRKQK